MAMIKIICPKCGRILGDTDKSLDCKLNCRGCKNTVAIKMHVTSFSDYLRKEPNGSPKNN